MHSDKGSEFSQGTINALTGHIAVLDRHGVIIQVNRAWQLFADANSFQKPDYGIGLNYLDACLPTFGDSEEQLQAATVRKGINDLINDKVEYLSLEYPCHSPTEKRWFTLRATRFNDDDDLRVVVMHENITDRKLTEDALRKSEESYRILAETASDAILRIDENSTIDFANNAAERIFGYKVEDLLGNPLSKLMPESMHEKHQQGFKRYLETGERTLNWGSVELPARHSDGTIFPLELSFGEYKLNKKKYFIAVARDLSERNRIDEKLRNHQLMLSLALKSSRMGVWELDVRNDTVIWSEELEFIFGIKKGSFGNTLDAFFELMLEIDRDRIRSEIKTAVDNQTDYTIEFRFIHGNGNIRWMEGRGQAIYSDSGKPVKLYGTGMDITDRKLVEREREKIITLEKAARHEAEAANRAKNEFLSVLSHELRTPLNAILGWIRMLKKGMLDEQRSNQAINIIERNVLLQNDLIEDLLDVSRIISGKLHLELGEVNFVEIIESAMETARPLADAKNIELKFSPQIYSAEVTGDALRLQQVVINLLNNAVKFTLENGEIHITVGQKNDLIILEIADNGIGISPDFLPVIFERFSQADSTTKRNFSGLGLGLTIVHHLVSKHGGRIEARSDGDGKGSTFIVEIPSRPTGPSATAEPKNNELSNPAFDLSNLKILLVDDDFDGLLPLKILLEMQNASVETSVDAKTALKKLSAEKFDLLISDIGMPEMDGYELIAELRAQMESVNGSIPAIALTAYASAQDGRRALESGFQFHIAKPIDFDELILAVHSLTNNSAN